MGFSGKQRRLMVAAILAGTLFSLAAAQQEQEQPQPEPFRVDVNLIQLRFTVQDANGRFQNGLPSEAFRILENGIVRETVLFQKPRNQSGATRKAWLAFLLDVSGSTFATRAEEIAAAQTFLDNVTERTHTGVFGFTDRLLTFQDFTLDRQLALRAFREARRHLGKTAIYDSLNGLILQMRGLGLEGDRKAVIVVSDGLDDHFRKSAASAALARQYGVSIYTIRVPSAAQIYIGPSSGGTPVTDRQHPDAEDKIEAFARLSESTGGLHFSGFEAILDFDGTLAQISDAIFGNLYTIGFYVDDLDAPYPNRRLNVQLDRVGLRVSLPFLRDTQRLDSKRGLVAALFENREGNSSLASLDFDFREIHVDVDVLTPRHDGTAMGLPFRIKISPYNFGDPERQGVNTQLGIIGSLVNDQGQEAVRLREIVRVRLEPKDVRRGKSFIYSNKLLAPPGSYELRLALLELATWRLTSLSRPVKIPAHR